MTAFLQMSHESTNLLDEPYIRPYVGAVISPINEPPTKVEAFVDRMRLVRPDDFSFILDPQLYRPDTNRGSLRQWGYFPKDFESADRTSFEFWAGVTANVANTAKDLRIQMVASPAVRPRVYSDAYFELLARVGTELATVADDRFEPMQTLIVSLRALESLHEVLKIASIVSETRCPYVYLLVEADEKNPRRELNDDGMTRVMQLIFLLERARLKVVVAYSSSDIILWKTAGATACATGKYFNVRRFTPSRFEETADGGGGGASYWFEQSLLASLRQADLLRMKDAGVLSKWSMKHPLLQSVLDAIESNQAWQKLGWIEWLSWFASIDARLETGKTTANRLLTVALGNWNKITKQRLFMEEGPANSGQWVPPWINAEANFRTWRDGG